MSHNPFRVGGQVDCCVCVSVATLFLQMGKNDFCCAPNCSNRRNSQRNIQFYRIPKDKAVRQKWLQRIRRKGFEPTESTRLCSQHFLGGKRSMAYMPTLPDYPGVSRIRNESPGLPYGSLNLPDKNDSNLSQTFLHSRLKLHPQV